ncbi:MAG: hypothetical protein KY455_07475 [Euryarchaeota archaeon]|nr:hypothetical protein [Euryarchaeota archaeon]
MSRTLLSLSVLLAVSLALGSASSVSAHEGGVHGFPHVNPYTKTLAPDERQSLPLTFEEGEFAAGWVFLVNIRIDNGTGPLRVELFEAQGSPAPALSWDVAAVEGMQTFSGALPSDGMYTLSIVNKGPDNATFSLYYDQSCNCAQKPVPVETPAGVVVFQVDPTKGDSWNAAILEPDAYDLMIHLALRTDDRSVWPDDFQILETSETTVADPSGREAHVFDFTAKETERHYFFVEVVGFDPGAVPERSEPGFIASLMIVPIFEQTGVAQDSPAPWLTFVLLAFFAVAASRRLHR